MTGPATKAQSSLWSRIFSGQRARGVSAYAQFEARVTGAHRFEGARQVQGGEGFHGTDAQFAGAFAHLANGAGRLAFEHEHPPRVVEQHFARRSEFEAATLADEQFGAELFFEPPNASGDVRLHGVQLARGGEDATFFDDGLKSAEGDEFHGVISKKEW